MARGKNKKSSGGKMLASTDQIVIKQTVSASSRYTGNLAPESEIVIRQAKTAKNSRY